MKRLSEYFPEIKKFAYKDDFFDVSLPLEEQTIDLYEDMVLLEFSDSLSLDFGCYPAEENKKTFKIFLIKNSSWYPPYAVFETSDPARVLEIFGYAFNMVDSITGFNPSGSKIL